MHLKESAIYTKFVFIYVYINCKFQESFLNTWLKRRDLNPRILRNSNMFDVKKQNLTSNIRRTKLFKNLKESLLTGLNLVCNNPICNEYQ